jgi:hypothetical protein
MILSFYFFMELTFIFIFCLISDKSIFYTQITHSAIFKSKIIKHLHYFFAINYYISLENVFCLYLKIRQCFLSYKRFFLFSFLSVLSFFSQTNLIFRSYQICKKSHFCLSMSFKISKFNNKYFAQQPIKGHLAI